MKAPLLKAPPPAHEAQRPDLSQWNGPTHPSAAVQAGVVEVFLRFGIGYNADPYAILTANDFNLAGAEVNGYWSFIPTLGHGLQAYYFLAMISAAAHVCRFKRAYLDCQVSTSPNLRQPAVPIALALEILENALPRMPGIYTRPNWWHLHVGRSPIWASLHPLWVADWNQKHLQPTIPAPWADIGAELWQIGSAPAAWAPNCAAVDCNIRLKEL